MKLTEALLAINNWLSKLDKPNLPKGSDFQVQYLLEAQLSGFNDSMYNRYIDKCPETKRNMIISQVQFARNFYKQVFSQELTNDIVLYIVLAAKTKQELSSLLMILGTECFDKSIDIVTVKEFMETIFSKTVFSSELLDEFWLSTSILT